MRSICLKGWTRRRRGREPTCHNTTRSYIKPVELRDSNGNTIDYGNRWVSFDGFPPETSYSVIEHPERFVPLHLVAAALIDYLAAS